MKSMFSRQVLRWVILCVVVVVFPQYANAWGGHYSVPIGIHRDASGCGTVYLRCTGGGDERKEDFCRTPHDKRKLSRYRIVGGYYPPLGIRVADFICLFCHLGFDLSSLKKSCSRSLQTSFSGHSSSSLY